MLDSLEMLTIDDLLLEFLAWFLVGIVTHYLVTNGYYIAFRRAPANRVFLDLLIIRYLRYMFWLPQLAYIAGGSFEGFRVQLSVSDCEIVFDNPSGEVREFPESLTLLVPAMSEEEINALPVSKYRPINLKSGSSSEQECSSSASAMTNQVPAVVWEKCLICPDSFNGGDLNRSLPCTHQFHANFWLKEQALVKVCKIPTLGNSGMNMSFFPGYDDYGMA